MRRVLTSVTVALGLGATVASTGGVLVATASPAGAAGQKRCTVTDERLRELSGLVATKTGYIVINDGTEVESRKRIFFLDTKCEIAKDPVRYSGGGPADTEDLALSPDGRTLWIADTGDNVTSRQRRERVAVWSMPVGGGRAPTLHRLTYSDGKPRDAEALLIGDDGNPLIITKVTSGKAEIFTPDGEMRSGNTEPVPMKKVGEVGLPKTETDNRLGVLGRTAITGAARSPDGARVVLRTYADAFEFDVTGGDVVKALTTGEPRVTALADPFGEAISYSPDGKTFLTVSDGGQLDEGEPIDILAYKPSTEGAKPVAGAAAAGPKQAAEASWFDSLTLQDIMYLVGAVGLIGVAMVAAGVVGILRARRRPAGDPDGDDPRADDGGPADGLRARDDRPPGGVYGGAAAVYGAAAGPVRAAGAPPAGSGAVYGGGRPAGGGGAVYGGRPSGGGVYGGGGGRPAAGPGPNGGGRPVANGGRPAGGRGGAYGGGAGGPAGGGMYGGGRAEPPRRGDEPDPRAGRRRAGGHDEGWGGGPYGQVPGGGRGYHGDRY